MTVSPEMIDLVRAFYEARLCAVHIDLQNRYFNTARAAAYKAVDKLAKFLRIKGVPNYFVAATNINALRTLKEFKNIIQDGKVAQELGEIEAEAPNPEPLGKQYDFEESVEPTHDDYILTKESQALFKGDDNPMQAIFEKHGHDVQIYDGVVHKWCVRDAIRGALAAGFRVYACIDATDCPRMDYNIYERLHFPDLSNEERKRLTITCISQIQYALSQHTQNVELKVG